MLRSWCSPSAVSCPSAVNRTSCEAPGAKVEAMPPSMRDSPPSMRARTSRSRKPVSVKATVPWLAASNGDPGVMRTSLPCSATSPRTTACRMAWIGSPSASCTRVWPVAVAWSSAWWDMPPSGEVVARCSACASGPSMVADTPTVSPCDRSGMTAARLCTRMSGAVLNRPVASTTRSCSRSMTSRPSRCVSAGHGRSPACCRLGGTNW